jgi:predicted  nucleic acid-binding Zn-ribbon protein
VEHVERQEDREDQLRSEVDELEQKGDELEGEGKRLDDQIDDTREDFERKKQTSEVPGLQED